MFNGKLGSLLPFDETVLPLVRAWINDEEVRRGTGTEGPVSDWEHRRWYESVMGDPAQRIFLIAQGKGNEANAVGVIGLRDINWRSRHAEYWIYLGDLQRAAKAWLTRRRCYCYGLPLALWDCIGFFSRSMSPTSPRSIFTGGLALSRKACCVLRCLLTAASSTVSSFPCCPTNSPSSPSSPTFAL
jgi:hypothetical protein